MYRDILKDKIIAIDKSITDRGKDMLLEEFDINDEPIINPWDLQKKVEGMPTVAVTCFSKQGFDKMLEILDVEAMDCKGTCDDTSPIYKVRYKGEDIAFYRSPIGSVGAGSDLEKIYAMGVEKVVAYGSCGVLDKSIDDCAIIIPTSAMRDEGMSYHYAPASDEIEVNLRYVPEFKQLLDERSIPYKTGKVWTTDGFYRETRAKMERRKAAGCICVDMECSAFAAIAKFRCKDLFHFFYAEDNLDNEKWDRRSLGKDINLTNKDQISLLAFELAARLNDIDK